MQATPTTKRRSSKAAATTPGDTSVASSTASVKPGVPWNVQKILAQELEKKSPLAFCPEDGNSVPVLLDSGTQALSSFLDGLVV